MRTIAVINQKGGCGKTTTSVNLAAVFARRGFRTLLVDLDPQSHCAAGLGVPESQVERDVGDAMLAAPDQPLARVQYLWTVTKNLDLLPSRTRLAGLEAGQGALAGEEGKERRLGSVLDRLSRVGPPAGEDEEAERAFDVCIIDCPPSIGLLTYNALVAARELLIPVETSFFSLQGADRQLKTMRSIARRLGVRHRARLLATIYDASVPIARDLLGELRSRFDGLLAPTIIRSDPALREAASVGRPVIDHAPESPGAEDYTSLCEWLIEHAKIERADLEVQGDEDGGAPSVEVVPHAGATMLSSPVGAPGGEPVGVTSAVASGPTSARLAELTDRVRRMRGGEAPAPAPAPVSAPTRSIAPLRLVDAPAEAPASIDEDVRRLLGAVPTSRGALFLQPLALGERIFIAGEFNGWSASAHEMRRNPERGVFELHVPLPPGPTQYRLVVDGRWMPDPYASKSVMNQFGQPNSVVRVPHAS